MGAYLVKRLALLPITLFIIVLANFLIINLAPGEPISIMQFDPQGGVTQQVRGASSDETYHQFRDFFGLTLPILFNTWPNTSKEELIEKLERLQQASRLSASELFDLKTDIGDRSPYCLDKLLAIAEDPHADPALARLAMLFFIRGAMKFPKSGPQLSHKEEEENSIIEKNNRFLETLKRGIARPGAAIDGAVREGSSWFQENKRYYHVNPEFRKRMDIFIFDTRLSRYLRRVFHLDFGVLRNDPTRTVLSEVSSRIKYSLTLSVTPLFITSVLCLLFGLFMAVNQNSFADSMLNIIFLVLWATPVFVVGPLLIQKVALHNNYPFTDIAFPIRGFSSSDSIYQNYNSWQRLMDILRHITLPLLALLYGALSVQSRLARGIFIDTFQQDFMRSAIAKGTPTKILYFKHALRYAAIPCITSIACSLGVLLGGSLIIETIFDIHGFGKFFYDAILNRDYNVMMFSALAGSVLSLVGYVAADLSYMLLDPRISLAKKR